MHPEKDKIIRSDWKMNFNSFVINKRKLRVYGACMISNLMLIYKKVFLHEVNQQKLNHIQCQIRLNVSSIKFFKTKKKY